MEENNHNKEMHKWHDDFIPWFGQCLLHVMVTSFSQGLHSTPLKWSKDQTWVPQFSSLYQVFPLWGILTSWSLSHLAQLISIKHKNKGSRNTHKRQNHSNTHTQVERRAQETTQQSCNSKHVLESLSSKAITWLQVHSLVECSKNAWYSVPCA
jgi:hypothetical protein